MHHYLVEIERDDHRMTLVLVEALNAKIAEGHALLGGGRRAKAIACPESAREFGDTIKRELIV